MGFLAGELKRNLGHGGTFDFQRERNDQDGFTQLKQFRDVSNFNVGLFCQQAGLTLDETLRVAGTYAVLRSRNSDFNEPYFLNRTQRKYIEMGYRSGASGMFGPPAQPAGK